MPDKTYDEMTYEEKLNKLEELGRKKIGKATREEWEEYRLLALECIRDLERAMVYDRTVPR